jgi:hypothetical protein
MRQEAKYTPTDGLQNPFQLRALRASDAAPKARLGDMAPSCSLPVFAGGERRSGWLQFGFGLLCNVRFFGGSFCKVLGSWRFSIFRAGSSVCAL